MDNSNKKLEYNIYRASQILYTELKIGEISQTY